MRMSLNNLRSDELKELYAESLLWIQWLMFGCDPEDCLKDMARKAAGQLAVCGSVWGGNDFAYRCRTCENDPTCSICVPCFQNGNHKDHDYSVIYPGFGWCDCGDGTALKSWGFCSKHNGVRPVQPLSEELVNSVGPVIDILLACWRDKVVSAEHWRHPRDSGRSDVKNVANGLSSVVVSVFLDFCNCSGSLLSFTSRRIFECSGLVEVLVRAENFLDIEVVTELYELLLKLLGEPLFKYEFAKVLIEYYPVIVKETIKEGSDSVRGKYMLLSSFSMQIFTAPTVATRLVRGVDLLSVLLGCLTDLFVSCVGEDGRLQVNKWTSVHETALHLVEDTRYVLSHDEVPIYIAQERPDILKVWLRLLSLVQGMDPHKRETGAHTDEDNDNVLTPFVLCHCLGNIHSLLIGGAYSIAESKETKVDSNGQCSDKTGILPHAGSAYNTSCRNDASDCSLQYADATDRVNCPTVPASAVWLIFECLKTIESCFELDSAPRSNLFSLDASSSSSSNIMSLRKKFFRTVTSKSRVYRPSLSKASINGNQGPSRHERLAALLSGEKEETLVQDGDPMDVSGISDSSPEVYSMFPMLDDSHEDISSGRELEAFKVMNLVDWPDIDYNVSSQEISFHIPVHRFLSLLLRTALKTCYEETGALDAVNDKLALASYQPHNFFGLLINGAHPSGFSAYIMENPVRLRVFCAQVRAGMWRKNGDAVKFSCEWYRPAQWLEIGLEQDLFLLQCCAALSPPD